MPPRKKYSKEDIIENALKITKEEGLSKLNARNLAQKLNSSVQPIFYEFSSMEELKNETKKRIYEQYHNYMEEGKKEKKAYKGMGLAYIKFARDNPEYFKILFMGRSNMNAEDFIMADPSSDDLIELGRKFTHFSFEEQKKFHIKVWIFTHGLACLAATRTIALNDKEIDELLENTVFEMLEGHRK